MSTKIFIIDDDKEIVEILQKALSYENITSKYAYNSKDALEILKNEFFDVILLDFQLPDINGFELLELMKKKTLLEDTEIIFMTGYGDFQTGMKAINQGCYDYIAKPFNLQNIMFKIKRVLENSQLKQKVKALTQSFKIGFENLIGISPKMKQIYKTIKIIADKDTTVLIDGQTGTGKELVARAIHKYSSRNENIFIPINCGAISENLLESELFGYEKGAFTGAITRKYGILETANNGTVFLDEINAASLNVQTQLLRFIETGEIRRIGSNNIIFSNARIIAASNENLEKLINEKKFREDLYHRLNIIKISLPPLKERKEDIPLLIEHFLKMYNKKFGKNVKIDKKCVNYFISANWTGNVRQLKNTIQSLVLLNETGTITPDELPPYLLQQKISSVKYSLSFKELKQKVIAEFEKNYLINILKETNGNVSKASRLSGLSRRNFIIKLKLYNINPSDYKIS